MGKQDKEFSWEEAEKLFPGSKASFIEWCSVRPEMFTFYWSCPSLKSTEIDGIHAIEKSNGENWESYVYFNGTWRRI